jgi:hypothetical protein
MSLYHGRSPVSLEIDQARGQPAQTIGRACQRSMAVVKDASSPEALGRLAYSGWKRSISSIEPRPRCAWVQICKLLRRGAGIRPASSARGSSWGDDAAPGVIVLVARHSLRPTRCSNAGRPTQSGGVYPLGLPGGQLRPCTHRPVRSCQTYDRGRIALWRLDRPGHGPRTWALVRHRMLIGRHGAADGTAVLAVHPAAVAGVACRDTA